jgi:hypothetical protein
VKESSYRLRGHSNANYFIEYDYDNYGPENGGYYDDPEDDYSGFHGARDYSYYTGLHIPSVSFEDVKSYTASKIGIKKATDKLPKDLEDELKKNEEKFTQPDNWDIYTEGDYYGDSVAIDAPRELDEVIEKWHWNQEGAIDSEGILPYVRDRGVETKGMSPLKAIKEQLARENGGVRLREVENAQDVGVQSISFKKIIAPNSHHYQKINATPADPVPGGNTKTEMGGVVIDQGKGSYKLLDGYHRYKNYMENTNKKKTNYIVLKPKR